MSPQSDHRALPRLNENASQVGQDTLRVAWPPASQNSSVKFLPASQFSWQELTDAYNQTRIDYIVPMPMSVARLQEYVRNYDVNLDASVVAIEEGQILGLAMLGVRPRHTWPTRVGVLPVCRQHGTGRFLMEYLIDQSLRLDADYVILEVIKGNESAHKLFRKLGFRETRDLLVLRRPPDTPAIHVDPYAVEPLNYQQILERLRQRHSLPSWLDETPSLERAGNLAGLQVELENGDWGWIVYQNTIFQLCHLTLQTEAGDPRQVGRALLHALHTRHPAQDTNTENAPADDPHLPAMRDLNYLEAFRRIEMRLDLKAAAPL